MDDAHLYDWFSKEPGAERDPARPWRCLRCQNKDFLKRMNQRSSNAHNVGPRTNGSHLAMGIAAIRVGAARPLHKQSCRPCCQRNCWPYESEDRRDFEIPDVITQDSDGSRSSRPRKFANWHFVESAGRPFYDGSRCRPGLLELDGFVDSRNQ